MVGGNEHGAGPVAQGGNISPSGPAIATISGALSSQSVLSGGGGAAATGSVRGIVIGGGTGEALSEAPVVSGGGMGIALSGNTAIVVGPLVVFYNIVVTRLILNYM